MGGKSDAIFTIFTVFSARAGSWWRMEGFIGRLIFIDIYDIFVRLEVRLEAKVDKVPLEGS